MTTWISIKDACAMSDSSIGSIRYAVSKKWIASKKASGRILVSREYFEQEKEVVRFCGGEREWGNDLEEPL